MRTSIINAVIAIVSAFLVALTFFLSVFLSNSPHFWAGLVAAILCWMAMWRSRRGGLRIWWWNCGALCLVWALFDLGVRLWTGPNAAAIVPRAALAMRFSELLPNQLNVRDPILGYRLAPLVSDKAEDLVYSTDAHGLRVSPPPAELDRRRGCVLFFGCSYTFGEGVSDAQTFAYLVETKTGGRYRTRNFGVGGSGPHYALAQLETGMVEKAAECRPTHAVELVLPHHLVRVSGKFAVRFGPRYALNPAGDLVRDGSLNRTGIEFVLDMLRYSSAVYFARFGHDTRPPDRSDIDLTLEVLKSLRAGLLERFPGLEFHVLYWNDEPAEPIAAELGRELGGLGVPVHELSSFLPEITNADSGAYLRGDHHPSPWAHEKIADYVVREVIRDS